MPKVTDDELVIRSLENEIAKLRGALESMCCQFASWAEGQGLWTGGLSALEEAFDALGWDDPQSAPEQFCDEPGCGNQKTCGWPSENGYRGTCGAHYAEHLIEAGRLQPYVSDDVGLAVPTYGEAE